jgi:gonadotropin-releasing hormone receptor
MNSTLTSLVTNHTTIEYKPMIRNKQYEKITIYSILFLIASIGNTTSFVGLLFMNSSSGKKKLKSNSRIRLLMLNLCVGDLMVAYIHIPLEIVWAITDSWLAGDVMCKLMMFLRTFGLYLSSFIIITITVDRYYAICKPMEIDFAYRLNKILLFMSWITAVISSIPQVIESYFKNFWLYNQMLFKV